MYFFSRNMYEMEVFILKVKFPSQHLPSKGNIPAEVFNKFFSRQINVSQILVISLEDEVSIVEEVLELSDTVVDNVALFFVGRPVQLGTL